MGQTITLTARDDFKLSAYCANPTAKPRGAIVVVQELFGVNSHIRSVVERYAALGFAGVAPAMFDRVEKGVEVGYDAKSLEIGRAIRSKLPLEDSLADLQAAINHAAQFGKVAVIGYCWGGALAFLSATRRDGVAGAIGYYGGMMVAHVDERPKVPCLLHFGERDRGIPLTDVEKIRKAQPDVPVFTYDAGHGFNCDAREDFSPAMSQIAFGRSQEFLVKHVG